MRVITRNLIIAAFLGNSLALGTNAFAVGTEASPERYQGILGRNLFGLKPAPIQEPAKPPEPPIPKIILGGITTIFGTKDKRVLMKVVFATKPNEQPTEQSLILSEGQRDGVVEVLEIDEKNGCVKLTNSGKSMTLLLEQTPSSGSPATAAPGEKNVAPRGAQLDLNGRRRNPIQNAAPTRTGNGPFSEAPQMPPMPGPATGQEQPLSADQEALLSELEKQTGNQPRAKP